jgi:hypothetical protein
MSSRFFRVPVEEIGYLRAIVEGYDCVATVIMRDPHRGEVEWLVGEGMETEADEIAQRLQAEIDLQPIARPLDWPSMNSETDRERDHGQTSRAEG